MLVPSFWKHPLSEDCRNLWMPLMRAFPALETPLNPEHCSMNPPISEKADQPPPPPPPYSDKLSLLVGSHTQRIPQRTQPALHTFSTWNTYKISVLVFSFIPCKNKQSLQISSMLTYLHNISPPNNYFSAWYWDLVRNKPSIILNWHHLCLHDCVLSHTNVPVIMNDLCNQTL